MIQMGGVMRRPLIGVAIALWGGVALGGCCPLPIVPLCYVLFLLLALGVCASRWQLCVLGGVLVLFAVAGVGVASMSLHLQAREVLFESLGGSCELSGVVVSEVVPRHRRLTFLLHDSARGAVEVSLGGRNRRWPRFGDRVAVSGRLDLDWLGEPVLLVSGPDDWMRKGRTILSPVANWYRWRRRLADQLVAGVDGPPEAERAVQAMVLGFRERVDRDVRASFSASGTGHVFALSGLHVAYLCAVVYFLVSCFGVPRRWWWLVMLPFVTGYVFVTGCRPSAIRAGIMVVVLAAAPALGRRPDPPSALALAAAVIAVVAPAQLLELGAIYSFTVVAGIMALFPCLSRLIRPPLLVDPFATAEIQPSMSRLQRTVDLFVDLVRVSVAAWLVSVPLSAHYFGQISLIAPLANLLVIPLTGLVLTSAVLSLALLPIGCGLSGVLNVATVGVSTVLIRVTRVFAAVPCAELQVACWPWGLVVAWYLLVVIGAASLRGRGGGAGRHHAWPEAS